MAKTKAKAALRTPIESILGISPAKASELIVALTERELQVAELMATGAKNGKIAVQLGISLKLAFQPCWVVRSSALRLGDAKPAGRSRWVLASVLLVFAAAMIFVPH